MAKKAWTGKSVKLTKTYSVIRQCPGISAGSTGVVVWDEGTEDVLVDFGREVPHGGLCTPFGQAWVPREFLADV